MVDLVQSLSKLSPQSIALILQQPDAFLRFGELVDGLKLTPAQLQELVKIRPDQWISLIDTTKDRPVVQQAAARAWQPRSAPASKQEQEEVDNEARKAVELTGIGISIGVGGLSAIGGIVVAICGVVAAVATFSTGVGPVMGLIGACVGVHVAFLGVVLVGGSVLALIGYLLPATHLKAKAIGTDIYGGPGGAAFVDDVSQVKRITRIRVGHGGIVDAVQLTWEMNDGSIRESERHGGAGGNKSTIDLAPDETIVKVTGRSGGYIDRIAFQTSTNRMLGPFGGGGGQEFTLTPDHGDQILGFHGRAGNVLDAIGVCSPVYGSRIFGGGGGVPFLDDLGEAQRIRRISVRHGRFIDAVQVSWIDGEGKLQQGSQHGGGGGTESQVDLEDDEWIVRVSGRAGGYLDRLEFLTSKGRYFGFGGGGGTPFQIDVQPGARIIGFWGRAGSYLDALGICVASGEREALRIGQRIALYSHHRRYLVAEADATVRADREAAGAYETFRIVGVDGDELHFGDTVALQSHHGKFLVSDDDFSVKADREQAAAWETFTLVHPIVQGSTAKVSAGDVIGLRSHHGRYLVAEPDHSVRADRAALGAWETWVVRVLG